MGVSPGDPDENVYERHQELCVKLNMDKDTADEAWQNYEKIKENYLLEVSIISPRAVFCCRFVYKLALAKHHNMSGLVFLRVLYLLKCIAVASICPYIRHPTYKFMALTFLLSRWLSICVRIEDSMGGRAYLQVGISFLVVLAFASGPT